MDNVHNSELELKTVGECDWALGHQQKMVTPLYQALMT